VKYRIANYQTTCDTGVVADDLNAAIALIEKLGPDHIAIEEGANVTEACLASQQWDDER
jgi:hypothetical protein